jgi:hypothetical protein
VKPVKFGLDFGGEMKENATGALITQAQNTRQLIEEGLEYDFMAPDELVILVDKRDELTNQ